MKNNDPRSSTYESDIPHSYFIIAGKNILNIASMPSMKSISPKTVKACLL